MNSAPFDNPDTETFLNCIRSLKRELREELQRGFSWTMSTESILLPETEKKSPESLLSPSLPEKKTLSSPQKRPAPEAPKPIPALAQTADTPVEPQKPRIMPASFSARGDSDLCLVRLCPSETELINSLPYTDEAGIYLQSLLVEAGFKESGFIKTYLHSSRIDFLPKDSPDIQQWRQDFFRDLKKNSPKAVLCLGERVSQILCGMEEKIDVLRVRPQTLEGFWFYFNYDPLYMFKKKTLRPALIREFQTILDRCFRS